MLPNTHPSISTMSCLKSFIDVLRLNTLAIRSPSTGSCAGLWQPKCYTLSWRIVNWRMTSRMRLDARQKPFMGRVVLHDSVRRWWLASLLQTNVRLVRQKAKDFKREGGANAPYN